MSEKMFNILLIFILFGNIDTLDNGLALRPPMGWMSWGYYACNVDCNKNPDKCLNEALILSVVDEFYNSGYQEAGYEYIIIDDCWSEKQRDENGYLLPDRIRFPNGMKYIADYIHSRGLKFGLYGSAGRVTCMQYPGSKYYLQKDAETFASWRVDYVKFDGCFVGEDYLNEVYIKFGDHLNKTGRSIVYSCSWPYYIEFIHHKMPDYKKVGKYCNLWRNYHDIALHWPSVSDIVRHYEREHERMAFYMGPGQWNDPDMVIVGNGVLTKGQSRIQMSVWAMLSAPLLLSCDMKKISLYERQLLQNLNVIAVNQDALGLQATPYKLSNGAVTMWVKKHLPMKADSFHSFTFAFVNLEKQQSNAEIVPSDYGLTSLDGYTVMDLFADKFVMNITLKDSLEVTVPPEDVVMYTLFPL